MEVFNLADYAGRGQEMAMNTVKMQQFRKEQKKEADLQTLAQQHVKEDGSVDMQSLANALPAAGYVSEGLEMQMQLREQQRRGAESEYTKVKETGQAYTKIWQETLKAPAMEFIKSGDETDLANLNAIITRVAPQLEYQLPNDLNMAKTEVRLMMPMLEAEGDLHKKTEAAAQARAMYGDDDERFKAAAKDLIDAQDEIEVKKKKLDYELENARLTAKKNVQSIEKGELEQEKLKQDIESGKGGKWTTRNISYKDKLVSGRSNDKGEIQIKKDGKWVNVEGKATIAGTRTTDVTREKWDKTIDGARSYVESQGFKVGQALTAKDRAIDSNLAKQMEVAMRQKFSEGGGVPQEAIDLLNDDPSDEAKQEFEDAFGVSADDYID